MLAKNFKLCIAGILLIVMASSVIAGNIVVKNGQLMVSDDFYVDSVNKVLYVDSVNNRVGIGTTSPGGKLDIQTSSLGIYKGLNIKQSKNDANTYYGLYSTAEGITTTNIGGYFSATGATNNYGLIVENGNVGIGTASPSATLEVKGSVVINGTPIAVEGALAYDKILKTYKFHDGTSWTPVGGGSSRSYYAGQTSSTYDGNDLGSYSAANAACNTDVPGSHLCTVNEILDTINYQDVNGINVGAITGSVWITDGPPGYMANANDCKGWTAVSDAYGRFWDFDDPSTNDGMGWLTSCSQLIPLACCKEEV